MTKRKTSSQLQQKDAAAPSGMELTERVQIKNSLGLHTRPATTIVRLLQNTKSDVLFSYRKETVNAKSILNILLLAARKNAWITIHVKGEDAHEVMRRLLEQFDEGFGEEGVGVL